MQLLKAAELFNIARNLKNTSHLMPPSMSSKSSLVWSVKFYLKVNNIPFKFN